MSSVLLRCPSEFVIHYSTRVLYLLLDLGSALIFSEEFLKTCRLLLRGLLIELHEGEMCTKGSSGSSGIVVVVVVVALTCELTAWSLSDGIGLDA